MAFLLRMGEQILCPVPPTSGDDRGEAVFGQLLVLGAILPRSPGIRVIGSPIKGTGSR